MTGKIADLITTEVVRNFVIACAQDMNAALWRSAFSAIIYEGRDSAVALLDADGEMLGQSIGIPVFVGNIDATVKVVIDRYRGDIHPGDIFVINDPYLHGTHLHDVAVVGPLFHNDLLVGFGVARAHWQDIGAIDPGSTMGSTSIFHEGIRLGPTRIVHRFEPIPEWFDLLTRNTRLKKMTLGDLNAQITAIRTGERRIAQLLDRIGYEVYRQACQNIFEQARLLDRQEIRKFKDGTYTREGYLDDDGAGSPPVKVVLTLTIEGDRIIVDLAGTSEIVAGSCNCSAGTTISALRLAYKTMINPDHAITAGSFETMEVRFPENCFLNAQEPAATEWYFTGLGLLGDMMISCLSEARPDRATAAHYGDSMVVAFFSMDQKRGQWISVEPTAGGWGGSVDADGESALINLVNGGFRNVPAEVLETKFPIRLEEFALRADSAGAGRHRGGFGVTRSYAFLNDFHGALWFDRSVTPAWGLAGGKPGLGPAIDVVLPDGTTEHPLKMRARLFPEGTRIITRTGGGGGYGDPLARPFALIDADLAAGLISAQVAVRDYGVIIGAGGGVDAAASIPRTADPTAGHDAP